MGPNIAIETFERFTMLGPRWFFRGVDIGNSEVLFSSQPYKGPWQRDVTARRIAGLIGCKIVKGKRK